jgi:hypothetical protein
MYGTTHRLTYRYPITGRKFFCLKKKASNTGILLVRKCNVVAQCGCSPVAVAAVRRRRGLAG